MTFFFWSGIIYLPADISAVYGHFIKTFIRQRKEQKMQSSDKYKVLNRDIMKYLAVIPMFIGHMIAWVNLMAHPDKPLAIYDLPA